MVLQTVMYSPGNGERGRWPLLLLSCSSPRTEMRAHLDDGYTRQPAPVKYLLSAGGRDGGDRTPRVRVDVDNFSGHRMRK